MDWTRWYVSLSIWFALFSFCLKWLTSHFIAYILIFCLFIYSILGTQFFPKFSFCFPSPAFILFLKWSHFYQFFYGSLQNIICWPSLQTTNILYSVTNFIFITKLNMEFSRYPKGFSLLSFCRIVSKIFFFKSVVLSSKLL